MLDERLPASLGAFVIHPYAIDLTDRGSIMSLAQEIDQTRSEIRTDGYPVSIGELISMYRADEIDIHPEFSTFLQVER